MEVDRVQQQPTERTGGPDDEQAATYWWRHHIVVMAGEIASNLGSPASRFRVQPVVKEQGRVGR
jgi:hypothetical protein